MALIRLELVGTLAQRDVTLRVVSAACKQVFEPGHMDGAEEFRREVISAVGEAFNNIALHAYRDRNDGPIRIEILAEPRRLTVRLFDEGSSFDPTSVPDPDLESLPESGLGLFIMKSFMNVEYYPGRPNTMVLTKSL